MMNDYEDTYFFVVLFYNNPVVKLFLHILSYYQIFFYYGND